MIVRKIESIIRGWLPSQETFTLNLFKDSLTKFKIKKGVN